MQAKFWATQLQVHTCASGNINLSLAANASFLLRQILKVSYRFENALHFMQEIHLMHKLSYDRNMVQLYGACLDSTCPMLVLEYMEGGDLQSCILQDCYPNSIGAFRWYKKGGRVALDVAKGLVFLHEQKVRLAHTSCV
jgi:serine/threonine protein kinase